MDRAQTMTGQRSDEMLGCPSELPAARLDADMGAMRGAHSVAPPPGLEPGTASLTARNSAS